MRNTNVMIIEDHSDTQLFFSTVLRMKKFNPVAFSTASSALNEAKNNPDFQLALVDLSLDIPVEDFISQIRAIPQLANLPIIIISGQDWSVEKAKAIGAQNYLRKPCDITTLLNAVTNIT